MTPMFYFLSSTTYFYKTKRYASIKIASLLLICFMCVTSSVYAKPSIRIVRKAQIKQSQITLGSVAKFKGLSAAQIDRLKNWVLAPAPVAGSTQSFPRSYLQMKLKTADLPARITLKLPKTLQVKRAVKIIAHAQLSQMVKQEIQQANLALGEGIDSVEIPKQRDLMLPAGAELNLQVDPRVMSNRVAVSVYVMEGEKKLSTRRIMAKISYRKKVFALKRNMRAGEVIQAQDLIPIHVPHQQVNRYSILTAIEATGARLRKNITAKVALSTQWLISKVLVKYGDKVQMIFKRQGIFLSAEGQALGQGKRGDMIKVKNIRSKKILTGRVVAPHKVEMEF